MTKREAILKLLALSDPPDLVRTVPQVKADGDPGRGLTYQHLPMRFVVTRRVDRENEVQPAGMAAHDPIRTVPMHTGSQVTDVRSERQ